MGGACDRVICSSGWKQTEAHVHKPHVVLLLYELKWYFANMDDIALSFNNQNIWVNRDVWQMVDWSAVTPQVWIEHTWPRKKVKHLHMHMLVYKQKWFHHWSWGYQRVCV